METYIFKLHLVSEGIELLRFRLFLDWVLSLEYEVNTVHGCQTERNLVYSSCKLFQWIDDAVEYHHVEYEGGGVDKA